MHLAYTEIVKLGQYTRLLKSVNETTPSIHTDSMELLPSVLDLPSNVLSANDSAAATMPEIDTVQSDIDATHFLYENEVPDFDLDSLNKSFPDPDSFRGLIPMLEAADAKIMYQLISDQVFARFCSLLKVMLDVPSIFENVASMSSTIEETAKVKGQKGKTQKAHKGPDMQCTVDSDDDVVPQDIGAGTTSNPVCSLPRQQSTQRLLSTSKQTVFDNVNGNLHMLPPIKMNFSELYGSMAQPNILIKQFNIGKGNEPEGTEFKDSMGLLIVTGDGAPAKAHLNITITPNDKLHSKY